MKKFLWENDFPKGIFGGEVDVAKFLIVYWPPF